TDRKDGVLTVPTAAVKTLNGQSYVKVLDMPVLPQMTATTRGQYGQMGSSTRSFGSTTREFGSTTRTFATTTMAAGTMMNRVASMTISSATAPRNVPVIIGLSDDTNTEILSGLERGQLVVTRVVNGTGSATSATPSIIGAFGGQRAGAGATTVRAGAATGGNVRFATPAR
ncbi:MAG TPA: hypothetical protein VF438_02830, partial [Candidatus Paceibacterota bacterium]